MIFGSETWLEWIGPIFDLCPLLNFFSMKVLLFTPVLSLFFLQSAGNQNQLPVNPATGKITYTEVVQTGAPLGDIWPHAFEWMVKNSDTDVVQIDNGDVSKLIGKSRMQIFSYDGNSPAGHINFTITVAIKDDRYRYELSNFFHTGQIQSEGLVFPDLGPCEYMLKSISRVEPWFAKKLYNNITQQIDSGMQNLIADLNSAIKMGIKEAETGW